MILGLSVLFQFLIGASIALIIVAIILGSDKIWRWWIMRKYKDL